jgi:hypothetical protein
MGNTIQWVIGAVLGVAVLNVILNSRNNTVPVANAIGSNSNTILQTLISPGGK